MVWKEVCRYSVSGATKEVKKMKKHLFCMLLAIFVLLSLVPITVAAEAADDTEAFKALLSSTNVKLQQDYVISETIDVNRFLALDLNGHVIQYVNTSGNSGSVFNITRNGVFAIQDSNTSAVHKFDVSGSTWVLDETNGTKVVNGGIIVGGTGTVSGESTLGGVIYNDGDLVINSGSLIGGTATRGGGVYNKYSFVLNGGQILGCSATESGGGVYAANGYDCQVMNGGLIANCSAPEGGQLTIDVSNHITVCFCMNDGTVGSPGDQTEAIRILSEAVMVGNSGSVYGVLQADGTLEPSKASNRSTIIYGEFWGGYEGNHVVFESQDQDYAHAFLYSGNKIPQPTPPTREGYTFAGWCTDYSCHDPWDFENATVEEYTTLYAKWECSGHYGGTATCCERAECENCGEPYGDYLPHCDNDGDLLCDYCGRYPYYGVLRVAGHNRYESALKIADQLKLALDVEYFDAIIISSGTDFADALAGSYLSACYNAPILRSWGQGGKYSYLDSNNVDYIIENLAPGGKVFILGGTKAVPGAYEAALRAYEVIRLDGANRYETNRKILEYVGLDSFSTILVCTGLDFADSLSASATGYPILLVGEHNGKTYGLDEDFLNSLEDCRFIIIGGTSAVSTEVEETLKDYGLVLRLAGADRNATSIQVAQFFFDNPNQAIVAYSLNYPDGLSGGALAYAIGCPLILATDAQPNAAAAYTAQMNIHDGFVLGGINLISKETANLIFGIGAA